jgi:hypothetical protein
MALKPHIVHVVGHTEADHAATAGDIIEACGMARKAIENALGGAPDMTSDPAVQSQVDHLVSEANFTLQAIQNLGTPGSRDPWADPVTLAKSVKLGILDAPQLRNNPFALGQIKTSLFNGFCVAINPDGLPLSEAIRLAQYLP